MRRSIFTHQPLVALIAAGIIGVLGSTAHADGASTNSSRTLNAVGLTNDGRLVQFKTNSPQKTTSIAVSGLTGSDTSLVGIDYRVQDGMLYGVGNGGGVYTLDPKTGKATFVNALTVVLSGTAFGV